MNTTDAVSSLTRLFKDDPVEKNSPRKVYVVYLYYQEDGVDILGVYFDEYQATTIANDHGYVVETTYLHRL